MRPRSVSGAITTTRHSRRFDDRAAAGAAGTATGIGGEGGSGLHDSYEVRNAMPINAFYDAAGKLRYVAPGQLTPDRLAARVPGRFENEKTWR